MKITLLTILSLLIISCSNSKNYIIYCKPAGGAGHTQQIVVKNYHYGMVIENYYTNTLDIDSVKLENDTSGIDYKYKK